MATKKIDYTLPIEVYNSIRLDEDNVGNIPLKDLPVRLLDIAQKEDPNCKMEHCSITSDSDWDYESRETYFRITIRRPETKQETKKRVEMYEMQEALAKKQKKESKAAREQRDRAEYERLKRKFEK